MTVTATRQFLVVLGRSNLLTPEQIRAAAEFGSKRPEPRAIARQLVQEGWLTRWQAQQLLAGRSKLFLGKYKLLEKIGQGGMGAVFKAEQPGFNRIVALKLMSSGVLDDTDSVERFVREIQLAAALHHPHIVAAYDADRVKDTYFLVMEYVNGQDVKAWMEQNGALPVEWSCEVIRQAALGLQNAHEHGLVHRDIKPANLLIVRQADEAGPHAIPNAFPHAKLLDLGLAKFVSDTQEDGGLTKTGQIMGTPDYISPEQAENTRDADIRSDIYSLGCTLYHMITGEPPFSGKNMMEKLLARTNRDAPRLGSRAPDVPKPLDVVVARMLAREPALRYQTPKEVADVLIPFAMSTMTEPSGDSVVTEPQSRWKIGKVEAKPDDTLNRFLNEMSDQPDGSTPKGPAGSSAVLGSPTAFDSRWIYGAMSFLILMGLLWLVSRGRIDPEKARALADVPPAKTASETPREEPASEVPPSEIEVSIAPRGGFALSFDGQDDFLEIPSLIYEPETPLTVEMTLTPEAVSTQAIFFAQAAKGDVIFLVFHAQRFSVGVGKVGDGQLSFRRLYTADAIATGAPIHVAGVYGDGAPRIYLNGIFAQGETGDFQYGSETSDPPGFRIGSRLNGIATDTVTFQGRIDEIRISKIPRYVQNYSPKVRLEADEKTLAIYHLDEGEGDRAVDSSGNGHHGTIHGANWISTELPPEPADPLQPGL